MKNSEFQKPLIQSVLVLGLIFICIGFVAGSDAHSFTGGIISIVKGALYTVLFGIGLIFSLLFSVIVLIAIFLAAVALYSPETSSSIYNSTKERIAALISCWASNSCKENTCKSEAVAEAPAAPPTEAAPAEEVVQVEAPRCSEVEEKVEETQNQLTDVSSNLQALSEKIENVEATLTALQSDIENLGVSDLENRASQLEESQSTLSAAVEESKGNIGTFQSKLDNTASEAAKSCDALAEIKKSISLLTDEIEVIKNHSPELDDDDDDSEEKDSEHRLLSYFDNDDDKIEFMSKVEEGVSQKLTYAELNEYFTENLSAELDTILKDHPTLTKDYIREYKKTL